ncbi:MAG: IS66 family insertion sequence element accessory protein TnpA [Gammaproteobacteria bacterium]
MSEERPVSAKRQGHWLEHVRACEASSQTIAAYAKAHGLPKKSLYNARARLIKRGLVPSNVSSGFQRARVVDAPALLNCRVHLANGITVEIGVEVSGLGEVLWAVQALS